jgi:hypothetical protein
MTEHSENVARQESTLTTEDASVKSVAYDSLDKPYRGFAVRASYLNEPHHADALIEIFRQGSVWRSYRYPAYRIYNIAAHFMEMVDATITKEEETSCLT